MDQEETRLPPFSRNALAVFTVIERYGGTLRPRPLLRRMGLAPDDIADAVNELQRRCWVRIAWRKSPRANLPADLPERFRALDRVTATRFGKWRNSVTWVWGEG